MSAGLSVKIAPLGRSKSALDMLALRLKIIFGIAWFLVTSVIEFLIAFSSSCNGKSEASAGSP